MSNDRLYIERQSKQRNPKVAHAVYTVKNVPSRKDSTELVEILRETRISDVVSQTKGLEQVTGFRIAILRSDKLANEELLDIDWVDLMTGKKDNNLEILAGDKVFISDGKKLDVLRFPPSVDHQMDDTSPLRPEFEPQTSGEPRKLKQ